MSEIFYHLAATSTNTKTGPIPVSTTGKGSCWNGCPLFDAGCYARGGPMAIFWGQLTAGTQKNRLSFEQFLSGVSALPLGQLWRHNQAGDLPGEGAVIDRDALRALVAANRGRHGFTYTHKPMASQANREAVREANAGGFVVNLSGNNPSHADELCELGIAPVVTILPEEYGRKVVRGEWAESLDEYRERTAALPKATPGGRRIAVCPATYTDTSCKDCGACARISENLSRAAVIGFPAHGSGKRAADAIARRVA